MSIGTKLAWFAGGALFGSEGLKVLKSKDAKKIYTHVTAAALRCKDEIMKDVELVQEECSDILAEAKEINAKKAKAEAAVYIEDKSAKASGKKAKAEPAKKTNSKRVKK